MSDGQPPVEETPAAPTAPTEPSTTTTTAETPAPAGETATDAAPTGPNLTNPVKEEKLGKGEELITSKAINEGVLNYKGPGLKGLIFSKKYFWLSEAPLEHNHLSTYLSHEKSTEIAHPNVAQATQSGKGLLFYAKRAEDKDHPQGILNIADMSEIQKGDFNDFSVKLHGKNHTFQALNKSERDGWIVALTPQQADAKAHREALLATPGYKSALEKYKGKSSATGVARKARSLSRPGKASKSRERVKDASKDAPVGGVTPAAPAAADPTPAEPAAPLADTPAEPSTGVTDKAADTPAETTTAAPAEHKAEEAAAGAAVGAGAVGAAVIGKDDKTAEKEEKKEEKKEIKAEKKEEKKEDKADKKASRSQSRGNKRSSIFGGLLGKKEDKDEKKAVKKEEKEEKKEIKAEEKAEKAEEKEEKKEIKAEEKAEKKEEKAAEKDVKENAGTAGGLDAAAVASRVIAAPLSDKKETEAPVSDSKAAVTGDGAEDTTPSSATSKSPLSSIPPKANKRNSVFGSFFGKKEGAKSPSSETPPAVPKKDEAPPVAPVAPQLDNPVKTPTTDATTNETAEAVTKPSEPIAAEKAAEPTSTSNPTPPVTGATPPSDKRRTSFFSGLGTKKEKRAGATSGDELTDGENKKSGGVGGLFRKASRAASKPVASAKAATGVAPAEPAEKTTEKAAEKAPESTPAPETAETAESKVGDAAEVPLPKTEPGVEDVPNGTEAAPSGEKADLAPADAGSNGIAAPEKSTPVEATA